MPTQTTLDSWAEQKILLEDEYPYLLTPTVDLCKSQIILSSNDELSDDSNPFDFAFWPRMIEQGHFQLENCNTNGFGAMGQ
jgi:hypothetical protein